MARPIVVRADWDPEAEVWVAESADLPALVTEAASIEALRAKLRTMIPELLALDGVTDLGDVPVEIVALCKGLVGSGLASLDWLRRN